jgi:hypothetical protein
MNWLKTFAVVFCLVLAFSALVPTAQAGERNQKMEFTFSQPVEIPGTVLPAGTYWFVLADSQSDRNIMEVFSADWSTRYATLVTASAIRRESTSRPELEFAEHHHGGPEALVKVFYPGLDTGHEFLYKHKEEKRLARDVKEDIVASPMRISYVVPMTPHS